MMRRAGFTLIEVLTCVLVLVLGLSTACGMVLYGMRLTESSRGKVIGMMTAMSVAVDPSPLATDATLSPDGAVTTGYLNGLWVERTETSRTTVGDPAGRHDAVTVQVDVYGVNNGEIVASVTRRVIEVRP